MGMDKSLDEKEIYVIERIKQMDLSAETIMDMLCKAKLEETYNYLIKNPNPTEFQIRRELELDKLPVFQE